jgi:hypothetical protein
MVKLRNTCLFGRFDKYEVICPSRNVLRDKICSFRISFKYERQENHTEIIEEFEIRVIVIRPAYRKQ